MSEEEVQPKRGRGRPRHEDRGKKVEPTLDPELLACLDRLVGLGGYGRDLGAVARYLIQRGIDDLKRAGILPATITGQRSPLH